MRRWELELRPELERHGVKVVTVCTDLPSKIRAGRSQHGLQGVMLSDPDLFLTDQFGLRNMNTAVRPLGLPGLPVPTTLLIDEQGIVRWKDQAGDYQQRSNPARVSEGLAVLLG